jgi:hypothetical protein
MLKTFYDCKKQVGVLFAYMFPCNWQNLKSHLCTDVESLADAIAIENFLFSQSAYASNGSNIY